MCSASASGCKQPASQATGSLLVAFDCADAFALSEWWMQVLGYADIEGGPNEAGDEDCAILDPGTGHRLLFVEVPDADGAKQRCGKNRLHFDRRPPEGTRDEELEVLLTRGATSVAELRGQYGLGTGWVALADPEVNEFCILRPEAEVGRLPELRCHKPIRNW